VIFEPATGFLSFEVADLFQCSTSGPQFACDDDFRLAFAPHEFPEELQRYFAVTALFSTSLS
jgi:hypothetical protein